MSSIELTRDIYGFAVRPHHLSRYKEYAVIYQEEEAERSSRWEQFLNSYSDVSLETSYESSVGTRDNDTGDKGEFRRFETWGQIRPSLRPVEKALSYRFRTKHITGSSGNGATPSSPRPRSSVGSEEESDDEFYDVDGQQSALETFFEEPNESQINHNEEHPCPWKEELDALVRGGVPMALRGELWQVFMGSSLRRAHGHYQALLTLLADGGGAGNGSGGLYDNNSSEYKLSDSGIIEKWTTQIEKDLPRTFPGHPALGEDGRNALRHLLTAYARHNPNVGYCQAMNFFAGLLLLMMPEENAFWTLIGILDDCFEGYYSENMLESQVDQLVLEELVRKHFPRLAYHLESLGVQVAWVTGPWFLSIFVNILPWESVLRVWDVLLYEGNRCMLFRTTLALLELYGPSVMATKEGGDAVTLLQSLANSTFDSSQLVLTACVGYSCVDESQLQELRMKYRPQVLAKFSERLIDKSIWHKAYGPISFSSKLCNFDKTKNAFKSLQLESQQKEIGDCNNSPNKEGRTDSTEADESGDDVPNGIIDKTTVLADLVEQVKCLKMELSKALEERRATNLRAEELETAFMELVKEDNRRLLTAKVETLESEVAYLKQVLKDKVEQEQAMVQVMVRMEQEQKITEDARRFAEDDADTQRAIVKELQAKYDVAMVSIKDLEKRTAMAESMLEATLQYQALNNGQVAPKRTSSEEQSRWSWSWNTSKPPELDSLSGTPKLENGHESSQTDSNASQGLLSRRFSLAWRERAKSKSDSPQAQQHESPERNSGFSPKILSPRLSSVSSPEKENSPVEE